MSVPDSGEMASDMAEVTSVTAAYRRPDDVGDLAAQGAELLAKGDLAGAERALLAAFKSNPGDADSLGRLGTVMMRQGRPADALTCFDRLVELRPNLVIPLHDRGVALNACGRPAEAVACFDRILSEHPGFAPAHYNRGISLAQLGRLADAVAAYDQALKHEPGHALAWNNRGVALQNLGRLADAIQSYGQALKADARCAAAYANRAHALRDLGRHDEAIQDCGRALEIDPRSAAALNERGISLGKLGDNEAALADFDAAIAANPAMVEAHENRFVVLTELGRAEEATPAIEEAIRLAPSRVRPYYNLTETRKIKPGDPRIAAMESLAQRLDSLGATEKIELSFSLGKAYADTGDADRAFARLSQGCALKRAEIAYNEAGVLDIFDRAARTFDRKVMKKQAGAGDPSELPVFILGMPRSGTTLIEQVLASHPQAHALGEIEAFLLAMVDTAQADGFADTPEGFAAMPRSGLKHLGERYLERVRPLAPDARRTIDKSLQSFRFAGLIHMALPNAKFIRVRREPLDTCLSCFSKLFVNDLPYTYDLGELGRYHAAFDRLMDHWAKVMPKGTLLEVRYEEVVADLEGQARRMLEHCGLDWDPACLDFHRTRRTIRTASVNQVRQPLYATSVGRWKPYEKHLGPLIEALGHNPNTAHPGEGRDPGQV